MSDFVARIQLRLEVPLKASSAGPFFVDELTSDSPAEQRAGHDDEHAQVEQNRVEVARQAEQLAANLAAELGKHGSVVDIVVEEVRDVTQGQP